jgi:DNA-binding NtrC family response regulator
VANPYCILLYEPDAILLETRRLLLERSGFQVVTATHLLEVQEMIVDEHIDLFVLGSSLPKNEYENAIAVARTLRPGIEIRNQNGNSYEFAVGTKDEVFHPFGSAGAFITAEEQTLKRDGTPSETHSSLPPEERKSPENGGYIIDISDYKTRFSQPNGQGFDSNSEE